MCFSFIYSISFRFFSSRFGDLRCGLDMWLGGVERVGVWFVFILFLSFSSVV